MISPDDFTRGYANWIKQSGFHARLVQKAPTIGTTESGRCGAELSASVPRFRIVAEPCAQGIRFKRYEQVAGMAELVLVSVEIVKT